MSYNLHNIIANASGAIVTEFSNVMLSLLTQDINNLPVSDAIKTSTLATIEAAPLATNAKYYKGIEAIVNRMFSDIETILTTNLVVTVNVPNNFGFNSFSQTINWNYTPTTATISLQ